jgi:hypothetical protein
MIMQNNNKNVINVMEQFSVSKLLRFKSLSSLNPKPSRTTSRKDKGGNKIDIKICIEEILFS